MAITLTPNAFKPNDVWGSLNLRGVVVTPGSADYTTGGYPITAAQVGLTQIVWGWVTNNNSPWLASWNNTTGALEVYGSAASAAGLGQAAASTDLSAYTFEVLFIGY